VAGRKKKKAEGQALGAPLWMITYGDMMSLLLCFFILLFSFSTLDLVKFRSVIVELQGALGVLSGGPMVLNLGDIPAKQLTENPSANTRQMEKIEESIERKVEEEGLQGAIQTTLDERGLMIRFTDTVLFDLGKAEIKPEAVPVLDVVAEGLAGISNPVRVEGHTDPTPIRTAEFPSNWELSTARATAIVHFLIESGGLPPERLSAAGYAFYHPVLPNNTPENRMRNRRVDVIILKEGEGSLPAIEDFPEGMETGGREPVDLLEVNPTPAPPAESPASTGGTDSTSGTSEQGAAGRR
jgi:chemotaxis protein MotB